MKAFHCPVRQTGSLFLVIPDMRDRKSIFPRVMPDMCYRASICEILRKDPRYQPAGMTENLELELSFSAQNEESVPTGIQFQA